MIPSTLTIKKLVYALTGEGNAKDLYQRLDPRKYYIEHHDFAGAGTFVASAGLDPWVITDTSTTGTPTYTRLDGGQSTALDAIGVASLNFDAQEEAQNVCLSFGDKLAWDINMLQMVSFRVKQGQATKDAATTMAFGVAGDRNDAIDSIANAALFRLAGAATNVLVVETDDGTNNNDDVAASNAAGTQQSLANAYKVFVIDFRNGLSNVQFYMGDDIDSLFRVAPGTTFDMSNYTANVQPFFQIQKTSDTNTDSLQIDYVSAVFKRT